jgi:hypothetical protein
MPFRRNISQPDQIPGSISARAVIPVFSLRCPLFDTDQPRGILFTVLVQHKAQLNHCRDHGKVECPQCRAMLE